MAKQKIPVYDICSLTQEPHKPSDFLVEPFGNYLKKHYQHLHTPHGHSFYHVVLFTKGAGSHTIDFTRFAVKPFQMYFMVPGQVHSWHFDGDVDGYIVNFSASLLRTFLLQPNYLDRFHFFNGISEENICQLPASIHTKAADLFTQIIQQNAADTTGNLDLIRVLLLQLFLLIEDACKPAEKKIIPQQKHQLLKSFRRLIDQHYKDIKLPKEYANLLYVTPNHLNALCQDLLRKTAGELIRDRVLLEAKRLLTNAGMSVTEIAYELNFQDNSYFNRFFKKEAGVTPDEFRKQFITT